LLNKREQKIRLTMENCVQSAKLNKLGTDGEVMNYLRLRTYTLRHRYDSLQEGPSITSLKQTHRQRCTPVAPAEDVSVLRGEITALSPEHLLLESGEYAMFFAQHHQIPTVLREIGRLREITFRGVGEGKGKARDLDRFDEYYTHLFVWNKKTEEVVGAYRLGKTEQALVGRPTIPLGGNDIGFYHAIYRKSFILGCSKFLIILKLSWGLQRG